MCVFRYRSLGGIAPGAPGYATVTIAPQVSKTYGPSSVNATVTTIRGRVQSSWVRHPTPDLGTPDSAHRCGGINTSDDGSVGNLATHSGKKVCPCGCKYRAIVDLRVSVPVGSHAHISVPLLGITPSLTTVEEVGDGTTLWDRGLPVHSAARASPLWLRAAPRVVPAPGSSGDAALVLETAAGQFHFRVLVSN